MRPWDGPHGPRVETVVGITHYACEGAVAFSFALSGCAASASTLGEYMFMNMMQNGSFCFVLKFQVEARQAGIANDLSLTQDRGEVVGNTYELS